ncbi:unnamed protein product [Spirodela intermedia]|uniref:Uncharacterized protein n=2 Tax=Spirodela intermedia TaxID=51605 RepID=A0A7I8L7S2_SPIIN|nr:unnamed protein product [Spirodela intermedia]CAA6669148.1 unnamed protein product [Spirodela intermedia]CAA7406097.1 unnamed protein product [Spirodela intermedia]
MLRTEEKGQVAAERIKAQALSQAKGLGRAQAERAAAAAVRNVNAYGQKEEGPSRWQERKEAKRQMYLMSTEKAVTLGQRKDLRSSAASASGTAGQCQRCLQAGHWTYECKNEALYISRPSRSQQLKNPSLMMKPSTHYEMHNPDERKINAEKGDEKGRKKGSTKSSKKGKRKHSSGPDSGSSISEASVFETDSASSVTESDYSSSGGSSISTSSDSEDERKRRNRRKNKKQKRRHRRRMSSSDSSDSESVTDNDSDDSHSQRKSRKHTKRH